MKTSCYGLEWVDFFSTDETPHIYSKFAQQGQKKVLLFPEIEKPHANKKISTSKFIRTNLKVLLE